MNEISASKKNGVLLHQHSIFKNDLAFLYASVKPEVIFEIEFTVIRGHERNKHKHWDLGRGHNGFILNKLSAS